MSSDRFVSPFPPPTPYQAEIADILCEECAEVIQRASKLKRFGCQDVQSGVNPDTGLAYSTNVERLSDEVGDLLEVIDWANGAGIIDLKRAIAHKPNKRAKMLKYLQYQPTEHELIAIRLHASRANPIPTKVAKPKLLARIIKNYRQRLRYYQKNACKTILSLKMKKRR